jgi:hypothetical protein
MAMMHVMIGVVTAAAAEASAKTKRVARHHLPPRRI